MKKKQIGKVIVTYLDDLPSNKYKDSAEEFLLNFFKKSPESERVNEIFEILNNNPSWDLYYNLVPQRRHILDWYPFRKNGSLLEVGAGTGAVTGVLIDRVKHVTGLELTISRAEILAHRFQDKKNLEVIAGNIHFYNPSQPFDYVVLIGVLEYAGMFSYNNKADFANAHKYLLNKCSSLVKKSGILFLAIENPLGARYFAGAVEDHYGEFFEGVENYPTYNGIRTYTKDELKFILTEAGFDDIEIYHPYPDYKLPRLVFHEDYLNKYDQHSISSFGQTEDRARPLFNFFSEIMFASQLKKEKLLSVFANSFLVVAHKK